MDYIIGVDGGGTKTSVKAYDLNGKFLCRAVTGCTNYNFIGSDAAADNLSAAISALNVDGYAQAIGFGDSSIDENGKNSRTEQFCRLLWEKLNKKTKLIIRSDAFMSLYGHTRGGEGVVMISGTGAMGLARDKSGLLHTVGGWGRLTGDEGSGYYIALSGIKAALRDCDGIGEKTALTDIIARYFGSDKIRGLTDIFYSSNPPDIASFSEVVSQQAQLGDVVCKRILHKASRYLANYTKVLITKLKNSNPCYENRTVGIYGGVLTRNEIVRGEYERLLLLEYPGLRVVVPSVGPEEAAALYVRDNFINEAEL
ncbi:MAG: N-acetylglucosamine kinase [Eubacteriales bacterium]